MICLFISPCNRSVTRLRTEESLEEDQKSAVKVHNILEEDQKYAVER